MYDIPHHRHFALLSVIVLVVSVGLIFYLTRTVECETEECFFLEANACNKAVYTATTGYALFGFETKECSLTKTVLSLSSEEPDSIRDMFVNRSLTCTYREGGLDPRLLNTLLGGLENCKGELKDSLYEIALAQYELSLMTE